MNLGLFEYIKLSVIRMLSKVLVLKSLFVVLAIFILDPVYSQSYTIVPMDCNSDIKNDFAPFVKDSILYFSSNRKHELLKTYLDQNKEGLYRLYQVKLLPNDKFGRASLFQADKLGKLNTSSICFAKGDSIIFLTQNIYSTFERSKGRDNLLGVFEVENNGGDWKRPSSFAYNSRRDYSNGQPSVSEDGKWLFYVSNQPGGYGETDIYQSEFVNGEWTEPKNIGPNVNTTGKELFPFYHNSGKLYFSSDQHNSRGQLDIFYTTWNGKEWTDPVPMDSTINSPYDDFSCFIYPDGTEGFFASNRTGNDDIYKFKEMFPVFNNPQEQVEDNCCFNLFDNGPYQSDTLPYIYKWSFGDGESENGLKVRHCFPGPGIYSIHLDVIDTLINQNLFTVAEYELELKKTTQVYIASPDTVFVNEPVAFSADKSVLEDFVPEQYYWDLGDGIKTKGIKIHHIFRKTGNYTIICGVLSSDNKDKMSSKKTIVVID